jgi:hypothetical protein
LVGSQADNRRNSHGPKSKSAPVRGTI